MSNTDIALGFLAAWHESGIYSVGAIHPDNASHAWLTTDDLERVRAFVDMHQAAGRNCYFQPNVCRPDLGTARASRSDVVVAECVHLEIDPPKDVETPEDLAIWQKATIASLLDDALWVASAPPQVIIFTGTGYACLHRADEAVTLYDQQGTHLAGRVAAIEARNRWFVDKVGADPSATDVSRLLRLPGTLNFPSESKRAKGRTEPTLAVLLRLDLDSSTDINAMPAVEPRTDHEAGSRVIPEFTGKPAPEAWAQAVATLAEAWPQRGQRHHAFLALSGALAHAGWPTEAVTEFTVDVARAMESSDDKAINDRAEMARQTVEKLRNGSAVSGWPTLQPMLCGDGENVVRQVQNALGMPTLLGGATLVDSALARIREAGNIRQEGRAPATQVEVQASIDNAVAKWTRGKDAARRADAEYIRRARKGQFLTDNPQEDLATALVRASMAVARALQQECPTAGDPADVIRQLLGPSSGQLHGDLPEIAKLAIETLRVERDQLAGSEFAVYTSGPSQNQPIPNSQHNFDVACARLGVRLRYDEFANRKLIRMGEDEPEEVLQDHHINRLRQWIDSEFGFKPMKSELIDLIDDRARMNTFHPVRDYLDTLPEWDGVERVGNWLTMYMGVERTPYSQAVGRLLLVAAARRIRVPGAKFDEMLVLEGEQGSEKSSVIKALCPNDDWFTDDFSLAWDAKLVLENTGGKWLVEVGELKGRTDENERVKSMMSRTRDISRMAYGHEPLQRDRQFVLFGTTNKNEYLHDPTGDRRTWPIATGRIDLAGATRDRDQIWAEARFLDLANAHDDKYIRLDKSLYAAAAEEQRKRRVADPLTEALTPHLHGVVGIIRVADVWRLLGYHDDRRPSAGESKAVASALQSLGWCKSKRQSVGGIHATWYERGAGEEINRVLKVSGNLGASLKVVAMEPQVGDTVSKTSQGSN